MSHQTGIRADSDLLSFFANAKRGSVRLIKVSIKNESLCLDGHWPVAGSCQDDFQRYVARTVVDNVPCYLLLRLDTSGASGHEWLLMNYTPDSAPVRQKMVYAATRATLKSEFGDQYIREEFHAASRDEVSWESYQKFQQRQNIPAPLTQVEQELLTVRQDESNVGRQIAQQTLSGVAFPIDQDAVAKLEQLRDGIVNYVQLSVDILNEAIKLERFDTVSANHLRPLIPRDKPRYHFYRFKHTFEGDFLNSVVFLYSMPGQKCSIKEKMLYSSCKMPFLDTVQRFVGISVDRKIEIDGTDDVNEQFLFDALHPQIHLHQPMFAKPKGPPGRGQKRIVRTERE